MKYKREVGVTLVITILVLFLKKINVLQVENRLGTPLAMIFLIIIFSALAIMIQKNIDKNIQSQQLNYQNLNILKYICAILIIILHLRPFQNTSDELDLAFNNIITRTCVPIFFLITGYFVAQKEKTNPNYIKDYIKRIIHLYLIWSLIYIPVLLENAILSFPVIREFLEPLNLSIPLLILLIPIGILIALLYTGVYYHLWYFPAIIFSLLLLKKWKQKFPLKLLQIISFFLLLFGATETYYGVLPSFAKLFVSNYYHIFFTTRNFLFFGLFYVVLGYSLGLKDKIHTKYCFEKLIISIFLLIFEAILLHDTNRLNSNILLSCIPLTYYLFISVIYLPTFVKIKFPFSKLSKYYYLIHPMIILQVSLFKNFVLKSSLLNLIVVFILTHLLSLLIITCQKYKRYS